MTAKTLVQTLVEIYGRIGDFHITPCDGAIPISEADRLAEKAVEDYTDGIRSEERAKIANWFLRHNQRQLADEIKAKAYLK